ncbi:MAG: DUF2628 domain-containing protein [Rhodospirillales bacterium]|nr:DUF2628 domain-containing protein [Rhodospirillales bacterium]
MARAWVYTVHIRPLSDAADKDAALVKEGFCWPAFFLAVPWALWHGMWVAALIALALEGALGVAAAWLHVGLATEITLGVALAFILGAEANDWRRRSLAGRGFVEAGVIAAPGLLEAERRFFAKHIAAA